MNWFRTVTETRQVTHHIYVGPGSEFYWLIEIAIPILSLGIVFFGMNSGVLPRS